MRVQIFPENTIESNQKLPISATLLFLTCDPSALKWSIACLRLSLFMVPSSRYKTVGKTLRRCWLKDRNDYY